MLQLLARFLAPPCCLSCNKEGALVCTECWSVVFHPVQAWAPGLVGVVAAGNYAAGIRQLVAQLKYGHQREAAAVLAQALIPLLEAQRVEYNCITAVPVVTARLRQRGYNQSELIAKQLSRHLSLPYHRLLVRIRSTQQVGKSRRQRLEQVEGAFAAKGVITGQKVLLVDDVLTTGSTLAECAKVLKSAGAAKIYGVVAARD